MVNAVSNSVVQIHCYGEIPSAGNYAMCGKAYDPRLIFAWPSAELAVMGGTSRKVLAQIEASSLKKSGEIVDEAKKALFDKIKPDTTNRFRLIMLLPDCGLMRSSIL
jgi:acetyl-CoA carboxylase carboxyltransferase component